jgi:hypothetical protein
MMTKNIVCNVRMTEEERHMFRSVALKNKTTVQEVLYEAVRRYINENSSFGYSPLDTGAPDAETVDIPAMKQEIAALEAKYGTTPNAETIAAMKEARAGRGEPITLEELRTECNALH